VLNEPETSLHPDLLTPLAAMVTVAAARTQVVVVTHSAALRRALAGAGRDGEPAEGDRQDVELAKELGETVVTGQTLIDRPAWHWPAR
jgi:predicted ATPase